MNTYDEGWPIETWILLLCLILAVLCLKGCTGQ